MRPGKDANLPDLVAGGAAVLLGAATIVEASSFPEAGGRPGPALFPTLIGVALVLSGAGLAAQCLFSAARRRAPEAGVGAPPPRPGGSTSPRYSRLRAAVRLATPVVAVVLYMVAVGRLGFLVTACGIVVGLMLALGVSLRVAAPAGIGVAVAAYWLFARLLRVPLPGGPLL